MNNEFLNTWIMYHEIRKLNRMGFSVARIDRYLEIAPQIGQGIPKVD